MSAKLGEILVRENLLTPEQLREALDYQRTHGGRLGFNLVKLGLASDDMVTAVLSRQYGVPTVNLAMFDVDAPGNRRVPARGARQDSRAPPPPLGPTLTLGNVV